MRSFVWVGHVFRFVSDILCYLDYLKSVFIQNKCGFNKYKSYKLNNIKVKFNNIKVIN